MNFATNPALMVNVGNTHGYPSIINNNIQGLSINYANHIIQQAAPLQHSSIVPLPNTQTSTNATNM